MLSDIEIKNAMASGEIKISGVDNIHIGPSSVDLHLDNKAKMMKYVEGGINVAFSKQEDNFEDFNGWDNIAITPGGFYLLSTKEKISMSDSIGAFVQGRSSIGRLGINIHCAGYCDVGFSGTITLEVSNFTNSTIYIPADTRICQIVFFRTGLPSEIPYGLKKGSKYQEQSGPTVTKVIEDYVH